MTGGIADPLMGSGAGSVAPLVSIICSVYNVERFVGAAIESVLEQGYPHWELLIGLDGCTDGTAGIVRGYADSRIKMWELPKQGLSATRNFLVQQATGDFICMFDGDDVMPARAIASRLEVLCRRPSVSFVDGAVEFRNSDLTRIVGYYRPSLRGEPLPHLLANDGRCFFGNTWMIRREPSVSYRFDTDLTHGEDLMFYITIANERLYDHTDEVVLWYRRSGNTLMTDLHGLENSYARMYTKIRQLHYLGPARRWRFKSRIIRFMMLGYLKYERSPWQALRVMFRYMLMFPKAVKTRS